MTEEAFQREPITGLRDLPDYGQTLRRTGLYLLVIVAGLLVAAKVLPRFMGPMRPAGRSRVIEVIETHRIEPRKTLYLIKVGEQHFLIGSTGDRLQTLAGVELDQAQLAAALKRQEPPPDQPSNGETRRRFLELLKAR